MFGIHDLALFIISGFLLNLTPGPDSILIMSKSAANGWRAGSVAAFGVCTGCYVHVFAAALGLSAILTSSATAFTIVKLIGAAYLVYMGLSALFSRSKAKAEQSSNKRAYSGAIRTPIPALPGQSFRDKPDTDSAINQPF